MKINGNMQILGRYIVADPKICHGQLTFRGTRIFVADVLEMVAAGVDWETIVEEWHGSPARIRGPAADRGGPEQQGDGRAAVREREHRQDPHQQGVRQTRRQPAHAGSTVRQEPGPHRLNG